MLSFPGCFFDGRAFENGDKFNLSTSPCVQCVCQVRTKRSFYLKNDRIASYSIYIYVYAIL